MTEELVEKYAEIITQYRMSMVQRMPYDFKVQVRKTLTNLVRELGEEKEKK